MFYSVPAQHFSYGGGGKGNGVGGTGCGGVAGADVGPAARGGGGSARGRSAGGAGVMVVVVVVRVVAVLKDDALNRGSCGGVFIILPSVLYSASPLSLPVFISPVLPYSALYSLLVNPIVV